VYHTKQKLLQAKGNKKINCKASNADVATEKQILSLFYAFITL
jgi:hypothetical protein